MLVKSMDSTTGIPMRYGKILLDSNQKDFFSTYIWYQTLIKYTIKNNQKIILYIVCRNDDPNSVVAMIFMQKTANITNNFVSQPIFSLTNVYSVTYTPVFISESDDHDIIIKAFCKYVVNERPKHSIIKIRSIVNNSSLFSSFCEGFSESGMIVDSRFERGNWHELIDGRSFKEYESARGKTVRKTARERIRQLHRRKLVSYKIFKDVENIEEAILHFLNVYRSSWKDQEQCPDFVPNLIRSCARSGALRLGVLFVDKVPVAARLVIVFGGRAILYKSAYDEKLSAGYAVGTALLYYMIEYLIDVDNVGEIDFGIGDEPYKTKWVTARRELWSINAYNPNTVFGRLAIAKRFVQNNLAGYKSNNKKNMGLR